ncbi:MAG: UDP-glucose 4-epimerase GalE [Planctomycetota bacterium]
MKILLTGGAGYIGSTTLRWLLKNGHDPIAYDNLSAGNRKAIPADRLVVGDLSDIPAMVKAMREHRIEAVMHFAALASVPESVSDPDAYYRVNVIGTKNLLDAMLEAGVKKIVFSSTAATYGNREQMPIREDDPQNPEHAYGRSKLAAEWMIRDYSRAYGLGYASLRYFNASGADSDGEFGEHRKSESHLIPLALYVAIGKRPQLQVCGADWDTRDGTCIRDYVHVEDLAQAHQLAIEAIQPGRGTEYNLGTGTGVSVLEVVKACGEVVGNSIKYEVVGRRPGDPAVLVTTPEKIVRELGWKPKYTDIKSIIETAWRWHQKHPNGYE